MGFVHIDRNIEYCELDPLNKHHYPKLVLSYKQDIKNNNVYKSTFNKRVNAATGWCNLTEEQTFHRRRG